MFVSNVAKNKTSNYLSNFQKPSVLHSSGTEKRRGAFLRRPTSHKHTYLASCHHVGKLWMLIDCQAQNVVAVFCIETLAGWEKTHIHTGMRTLAAWTVTTGSAFESALCPLTGGQVEHDANRRSVVDDVRPLVQVVHVIAAVSAAIAEHQLQHQILRQSHSKNMEAGKSERSLPWQLNMLRASWWLM